MSWIERGPKLIMRSYLFWCATLNRVSPRLRVDGLDLLVSPSTCKPLHGEAPLASVVEPGQRVLDVGTGSGIIAISAARRGAIVTASDISPTAIDDTQRNAKRNDTALDTVVTDGYEGIDGPFDHIFCHLPYVESVVASGVDQQWAATGSSFAELVITGSVERLAPNGQLTLLWPSDKEDRVGEIAARAGLKVVSAERWHVDSKKLAALRLVYFDVGFAATRYVLAEASAS